MPERNPRERRAKEKAKGKWLGAQAQAQKKMELVVKQDAVAAVEASLCLTIPLASPIYLMSTFESSMKPASCMLSSKSSHVGLSIVYYWKLYLSNPTACVHQ